MHNSALNWHWVSFQLIFNSIFMAIDKITDTYVCKNWRVYSLVLPGIVLTLRFIFKSDCNLYIDLIHYIYYNFLVINTRNLMKIIEIKPNVTP